MPVGTFFTLMSKLGDSDTFRAVLLLVLLAYGALGAFGFRHLESKAEANRVELSEQIRAVNQKIERLSDSSIHRNEFSQIERRLDQFIEHLDKRLDRIEARQ